MDRVVPDLDAWRQAPSGPASSDATYKEWVHFCVRLPGKKPGNLLLNVNATESMTNGVAVRSPRLVVLAELDEWFGSLESFDSASVRGTAGGLDVCLANNRIAWRDGAYRISIETPAVRAELTLRPLQLPSVATSVCFGPGHAMHWVVLPRLEASGTVLVGRRRLRLDRELAYHDHNWGHFRFGADLAWEWGFVHPKDANCPFSLVVLRVSDGGRHRALASAALLWRAGRLLRTFQNRELGFTLEGTHRSERPLTLPGITSLLVPGTSSGVPSRFALTAAGSGDELSMHFATESKARVALPNELDPFRLVVLNETSGAATVRGKVQDEAFEFEGRSIMEFVRG